MAARAESDTEKRLLEATKTGDVEETRKLVSSGKFNINCTDEHGMTPLMQAAYKGQSEVCEMLLAHGADVNANSHEHQYTALMFATLSGSLETTKLLLEAGAKVSAVNNLGRTASQIGAFVGRHECVNLISNFIGKEEIEYYTRISGLEKEPKLKPFLVTPLHKYILMTTVNPVRLVLYLTSHPELLENSSQVINVLNLKSQSCVKCRDQVNEIAAMKLHYLSCVLKTCVQWRDEYQDKGGIDGFIKHLLRGRDSDGFPLGTENFLRLSVKKFEHPETALFTQLVSSISAVEMGNDPTSLSVLTQALYGHHSADFTGTCIVCGERDAKSRCSSCKSVDYCGQSCQKLHWFTHKKHCKRLAKEQEAAQIIKLQQQQQEKVLNEELRKEVEKKRAKEEAERSQENGVKADEDKTRDQGEDLKKNDVYEKPDNVSSEVTS